jgi:hypothetical protein
MQKIHYRNPTVGVAVLVVEAGRLYGPATGTYEGLVHSRGACGVGLRHSRGRLPSCTRKRAGCGGRAGFRRPFQFSRSSVPDRGDLVLGTAPLRRRDSRYRRGEAGFFALHELPQWLSRQICWFVENLWPVWIEMGSEGGWTHRAPAMGVTFGMTS